MSTYTQIFDNSILRCDRYHPAKTFIDEDNTETATWSANIGDCFTSATNEHVRGFKWNFRADHDAGFGDPLFENDVNWELLDNAFCL